MKKARIFKTIRFITAFFLFAGVVAIVLILEPSVKIKGYMQLDKNRLIQNSNNIQIYDLEGEKVDSSFIVNNRINVSFEDINNNTKNAFISVEDNRFYDHIGIDYFRVLSAIKKNVKNKNFGEGASTITQQLVKNTHLSGEKKIKRKIVEARIATDIERRYSKNEILAMYLNAIYFGNNIYGIGRASQTYFQKNVSDLTLNESAFLAGVINNPSKYNPVTNLENANKRRKLVLNRMLKYRHISKQDYNKNIDSDIQINNIYLDQYASSITTEGINLMNVSGNEFFNGGYKIETYLDKNLQEKINLIIQNYSFLEQKNAIIHTVVMNNKGEILANNSNVSYNLYNNQRQPGSTIKPMISYAPAFENKSITPSTYILDEPTDFNGYKPSNYKNRNLGLASVKDCLKYSQNIPAVKLTNDCGVEYCKQIAQKLGCTFEKDDNNLALALGGMSKGLTLAQLANSYQAFANGGEFIKFSHIKKITNINGEIVYENKQNKTRAVSKETAYFINDILSECAYNGTAKRIGKGYAAKTGTVGNENGNSDSYVVAYSKNYIVAVWIGARKGLLRNEINGATHTSIIAKKILDLLPKYEKFEKPNTIIDIDLDKKEYIKNHKIVIAHETACKKDTIKAEFIKENLPKDKKRIGDYNDYLSDTKSIDIENFVILKS